jgi:iron(III) transport system permease protein
MDNSAATFSAPIGLAEWMNTFLHALPSTLHTTLEVLSVAILTAFFIGCVQAWLTHRFPIPLRGFFTFSAIAPIATPPAAFVGLYQGATNWPFFESTLGLGACLGVATAPFVFLLFRVALARLSHSYREAAQMLGLTPMSRLFALHIPLLTLPILAAAAVVFSESVSDFASAERAGVETFSVALHNIWMGTQRTDLAVILAIFVCLVISIIIFFTIFSLRKFTPFNPTNPHTDTRFSPQPGALKKSAAIFVLFFISVPGFLFPTYQTAVWAYAKAGNAPLLNIFPATISSLATSALVLLLGGAATIAILLFLYNHKRTQTLRAVSAFSIIPYTLPALLLGVFTLFLTQENAFLVNHAPWITESWITESRLPVAATLAMRFLPLILLPALSELSRIPPALVHAARVLGQSERGAFFSIILPHIFPTLVVGVSLAFIECMKEITISQLLRPFQYSSISLRIFNYLNTHQHMETAVWVFTLQLLLVYPILLLQDFIDKESHKNAEN